MKISRIGPLRSLISNIFNENKNQKFPQEIIYNRGIEFPKYRITIEEIEEDYFIDSKGQKWARITSSEGDEDDK